MDADVPATRCQASNEYILKEQIGAGGMGLVYRGFDVPLKRDVALKILNEFDPDSVERFVREREITADLDHPSFVRILSMGYLRTPDGRRPFYTMPLLRGETLASMIHRRSQPDAEGEKLREEFPLTRLLQLVQQLCLALESAHDRGIIHRDVKPGNIILGLYGEVYIVDLGLAKYVQGKESTEPIGPNGRSEESISTRLVVGTPFFMAPEQILDPSALDARTDVFGLGATLYYILTGEAPVYRSSRAPGSRLTLTPDQNRLGWTDSPSDDRSDRAPDRGSKPTTFASWNTDLEDTPSTRWELLNRATRGVLVPPDEVVAHRRRAIESGRGSDEILDPVDAALGAICMKALARKPEDRYPNCRAMWQELQQFLEGQFEMIFAREARELTRTMSRGTLPAALRSYELAERRIRQRIMKKESAGRLAIEEKLDLLDVFLEKAKIYERRGDSASIIRAVTRAEPLIETALEVLHRHHVQLLIAKGTAQVNEGALAEAKKNFARAMELSRARTDADLRASACWGYGVASAGCGNSVDFGRAREALRESITLADRAGDAIQGVRSRVSLARVHLRQSASSRPARALLMEALHAAGQDPALLCEVHLAFGAMTLDLDQAPAAVRHLTTALQHAEEMDAQNLARKAHFLLGQASHVLGDAAGRVDHFRRALQVRGPRRVAMEREIAGFYARCRLDPGEVGLRAPHGPARTRTALPEGAGPRGAAKPE